MSAGNRPVRPTPASTRFDARGPGDVRGRSNQVGTEVPAGDGSNGAEGLMDYEAAARYLCTTPRHVRELWAKRYLAAIKVGRHVRFTRADLDAFINARRVDALR